jgi:hypothetical protein
VLEHLARLAQGIPPVGVLVVSEFIAAWGTNEMRAQRIDWRNSSSLMRITSVWSRSTCPV